MEIETIEYAMLDKMIAQAFVYGVSTDNFITAVVVPTAEGKKLSNIYTSNDIGEIEGVDFYNKNMILGFNGYDNTIKFYLSNIPKIDNIVEEEEIVEEAEIIKKKNYELYIFLGIAISIVVIILVIIFRHKKKVIR